MRTVQLYRDSVKPLTDRLGARALRKLSTADVRQVGRLEAVHGCRHRSFDGPNLKVFGRFEVQSEPRGQEATKQFSNEWKDGWRQAASCGSPGREPVAYGPTAQQ